MAKRLLFRSARNSNGNLLPLNPNAVFNRYFHIVRFEHVKCAAFAPQPGHNLIIDVRDPEEIKIQNSINIPLECLPRALYHFSDAEFEWTFGTPRPCKTTGEIIFYCSGVERRSTRACHYARSIGYLNAKDYLGGITEWQQKIQMLRKAKKDD